MNGRIRPITLCVIRREDSILVYQARDDIRGEMFYRPLGGGIEFGETGTQALLREMHEELGARVTELRYLGMIENLFTYQGSPLHELVLVFEGEFADRTFYDADTLVFNESGQEIAAGWVPLAEFRDGVSVLYPDGLLELIDGGRERRD